MRYSLLILIGLLLALPPAPGRAAAPDSREPAAALSDAQIATLIGQLGDPSAKVRSEAAEKLKAAGKAVLPALKDAQNDPDPEIRAQANALIKRLDRRPVPGGPLDPRTRFSNLHATVVNGAIELSVEQDGRQIRIVQNGEALELSVTGLVDGKRVTETYRAASPAELKENDPDAYVIYEKFAGPNGAGWITRQGALGPGNILVQGALPNILIDPFDQFVEQLDGQMRRAKVDAKTQQNIQEQVQALGRLKVGDPLEEVGDRDKRLKEFFARSDEFRKVLEDLKLPDPGDALPPPARSRLGIQFGSFPGVDGETIVVDRVVSDSRAQKMGMQPGDVLRKIDGKPIQRLADVRPAIMATKGQFEIEIERGGKVLTIKEAKPE